MIYISHRGNLDSIQPKRENTIEYIQEAIDASYDVEIDIRESCGKLFLGHDVAETEITIDWLLQRKNELWIHAKDFNTLTSLIEYDLRIFFHEKEAHTIINNTNLIWSHDINSISKNSIIPLLDMFSINTNKHMDVYGICSDYVSILRSGL